MLLSLEFELRPLAECRMTKMGGRLALGFGALSDGALALCGDGGQPLLPATSIGWPGKKLVAPDAHLLTLFDDLVSVLAIQVRPLPVPDLLGTGSALAILERYESLVAASEDDMDDVPEHVLAAGDYLISRSIYLPGDCRVLVLDRDGSVEMACEGREGKTLRDQFVGSLMSALQQFFSDMHQRVERVVELGPHPGSVGVEELRRQGQQWHRRLEALLRRAAGEKFAPLSWPW